MTPHTLPDLPYAVSALEPHVDAPTMSLHHDMHHAGYVAALNKAMASAPAELRAKSALWLLENLTALPGALRNTVRHNAGGHVNHSLLWTSMSADGGGAPSGPLAAAIEQDFDSLASFKKQFEKAGEEFFGVGWVWLVIGSEPGAKLEVMTTAGHDNPVMHGHTPLLVNDLWEHAYYLQHQNRKAEYLHEWWSVVDWRNVAARLAVARHVPRAIATPEALTQRR